MTIELIFLIVFISSIGGAILILIKKAPILSTMPKNGSSGIKKHKIVLIAEGRIKSFLAFFSDGIILHKFLSWTKCRVIKFETWIDEVLHGIRNKAKQNKLNKKK